MNSSINDLFSHQAISSLVAGPGVWAFQVKQAREQQDDYSSVIWRVDAQGQARQMTAEKEYSSGPRWASDGKQLAFIRTADKVPQVFAMPVDGGEARQITSLKDSAVSVEHWDAEGGKMLVCVKHAESQSDQDPKVIEFLPFKQDGSGITIDECTHLYEVDATTGTAEPLVESGGDVQRAKWSPDRRSVAFLQRRTGAQRHLVDVWLKQGDAEPKQLTQELASISELAWSPDGKWLALAASLEEGTSMSWPYLVNVESGETRRLAQVEMTVPACVEWEPEGNRILMLEAYRGLQRVVSVDLEGNLETVRELEDRQIAIMAGHGKALAFVAGDASSGPEIWVGQDVREPPTQVKGFNEWRAERDALRVERRSFKVPDGEGGEEQVEGWLLRPQDGRQGQVLLELHGGPHSHVMLEHETHVHWGPLTDMGWNILALNTVGSTGYGEDFAKRIIGRWGELDWPQYQAALKCLREEGIANDTVAVFGHSYGGFLAAWALGHDETVACGVISGGVIDIESHTGTSDTGYYVGPYSMGAELAEDRERYQRLSPLTYAERIVAPTLLLQGSEDERCPQGQAEQLFTELIREGRAQARMVIFPGGSHHVSSTGNPSHRLRFYQELIDWLSARVKDAA
jgi:dipeptidyl aminopeptidase/acylaminoacyl peptidase